MRTCAYWLLTLLLAPAAFPQDAFELYRTGGQRVAQGRCEEAVDFLLRTVKLLEADSRTRPEDMSTVWQVLGTAYGCSRQNTRSVEAYKKALEINPAEAPVILASLAVIYQREGRSTLALETIQAAADAENKSPHRDAVQLAEVLNNRSSLEMRLGHPDAAEQALRQARDILETANPSANWLLAYVLNNLAVVRLHYKDFPAAVQFCSDAVALGSGGVVRPQELANMLNVCADSMKHVGKKAEASQLLAQSKAITANQPHTVALGQVVDASELMPRK